MGHESDLFRFTLKHSIILTAVIGLMAYLQAYVIHWIVPVYTKAVTAVSAAAAAPAATAVPKPVTLPAVLAFPVEGLTYLAITATVAILVVLTARIFGKGTAATS